MSEKASVSVIIPTYNRAFYLEKAIQSVLDQSYPDFDVIVVDDGSTDNTAEVVRKFKGVMLIQQQNLGVAVARNTGIHRTRGKYVAFLDDDDLWLPGKLEKQVAYMEDHPATGMVYSAYQTIDSHDTVTGEVTHVVSGQVWHDFMFGVPIAPPTVMVRREVLDTVGVFDKSLRLGEDLDLWIRIARRYPIHGMKEPLVQYRIHNSNTAKPIDGVIAVREYIYDKQFASGNDHNWILRRQVRASSYYWAGLERLNQTRGVPPEVRAWLFRGMRWWPFSRRGGLLAARVIARSVRG